MLELYKCGTEFYWIKLTTIYPANGSAIKAFVEP